MTAPVGDLVVLGEELHCADGLFSQDGWVVVDDTNTPRFEQATGTNGMNQANTWPNASHTPTQVTTDQELFLWWQGPEDRFRSH